MWESGKFCVLFLIVFIISNTHESENITSKHRVRRYLLFQNGTRILVRRKKYFKFYY